MRYTIKNLATGFKEPMSMSLEQANQQVDMLNSTCIGTFISVPVTSFTELEAKQRNHLTLVINRK